MTTYKVQSKERHLVSRDDVFLFCSSYNQCVLDIGAGDGKGSLRYARKHSEAAVIALDSSYGALQETSKSASKKPSRGGAENLLCLYGNIKEAHEELTHCADYIRIYLPWGDLLEGIAEQRSDILQSIARCARTNAHIDIVINAEIWKNNLPKNLAHLGEVTPSFFLDHKDRFLESGISINQSRLLSDEEISSLDTTWSAKLMSSRTRADFVMATGVVTYTSPEE